MSMKIATWNVERLKHKSKLALIQKAIERINADILVLTETDSCINTGNYKYRIDSSFQLKRDKYPNYYLPTENRITILTNYDLIKHHETYDKDTTLCVELKTPKGNLIVYGTIIGIYGNRNENFKVDLDKQLNDFDKLSKENNLCIIGDYNISFEDNYYFTNEGRNKLKDSFTQNNILLHTWNKKDCIDHIAISTLFTQGIKAEAEEWNKDKKLSDHKGIYVNLAD